MICIREGLNHTVIGDRDRLMSPFECRLDICLNVHNRVHLTHLRMRMKLYTLPALIIIHTVYSRIMTRLDTAHGADADLMAELIAKRHSLHNNKFILFNLAAVLNLRILLRLHKDLDRDRIGEVSDIKHQKNLAAAKLLLLHTGDHPLDHDLIHLILDIRDLYMISFTVTAIEAFFINIASGKAFLFPAAGSAAIATVSVTACITALSTALGTTVCLCLWCAVHAGLHSRTCCRSSRSGLFIRMVCSGFRSILSLRSIPWNLCIMLRCIP